MAGAGQKNKKKARQQNRSGHHEGSNDVYDGPSERPGSSAGPGQASSSRGGPPSNVPPSPARSNAPAQPSVQAPSARSSSRPQSAAGPPGAASPPLRDPALDPARAQAPRSNTRIDWGGNAFNYQSGDAVSVFLEK